MFSRSRSETKKPRQVRPVSLQIETLEDRHLLSTNAISGFAFHDLNSNGLRDVGETPIANSRIMLYSYAGALIGSTFTNANGYYEFLTDGRIPQSEKTQSQLIQFATGPTNITLSRTFNAFNPTLGQLIEVEIVLNGQITSQIRSENLDPANALITGNVSGNILLNAPRASTSLITNTNAQSFNASAYDGISDYAGTSGITFASRTSSGTKSLKITSSADLAAYIGTGTLSLDVLMQATSNSTGGGNLLTQITSSGSADVTIIYKYIGSSTLPSGMYRVVQEQTPPGYVRGLLSRNNVVIPGSFNQNQIVVNVQNNVAPNNNFAALKASSISGSVYLDIDNNGVKGPSEVGIANATIQIYGKNDLNQTVSLFVKTGSDGSYQFANLRPGTYIIGQIASPPGLLQGVVNAPGSLGGVATAYRFSSVVVTSDNQGVNYNFGWLKPASITGFIYADANQNTQFDAGDRGVVGLYVLLRGVDDRGQMIQRLTRSDATGAYRFDGLRPGEYEIVQWQVPSGWERSAINIGSLGGIQATAMSQVVTLQVGDFGRDYNFGFLALNLDFGKGLLLGSIWRQYYT